MIDKEAIQPSLEMLREQLLPMKEAIHIVFSIRELAGGDMDKAAQILVLYLLTPPDDEEEARVQKDLLAMLAGYIAWTTDYEAAAAKQPADVE